MRSAEAPEALARPAADVPAPTPTPTLRDFAIAALAATAREALARSTDAEAAWLSERLRRVETQDDWRGALQRHLAAGTARDERLLGLAARLGLHPAEVLAVALACAVEDDVMLGRALVYLQAPAGGSRPTLGLLDTAFAPLAEPDARAIDVIAGGAAARCGLLGFGNDAAPRPEHNVMLAPPLCLALAGIESEWPGATLLGGAQACCPLSESMRAEAARHAERLASAGSVALLLRGGSPAERRVLAAEIAHAAGRRTVLVAGERCESRPEVAGFGVWAALNGLIPAVSWELGPGERRILPRLAGYDGPLIALNGQDGSIVDEAGALLAWTLAPPPREERAALWSRALGPGTLAQELAALHRHRAGRIAQLGAQARQLAALDQREQPTREDVLAAAWSVAGAGLDALAEPLADAIPDEALVTTPQLARDLAALLARCRQRDALGARLGPSIRARYHPGVKALLCGPSGAGKTLAAGWLATRLGLPLYRVDLASITSKYIGETEKNLAQLLAHAEQAEVMLLFDEADSLFGKRTEVKESNDRYANAQTNYLLQRIESFDGVALLTSNSRSRFDAAFMRRLDVVIDFPLPGPQERRALWLSHLGERHGLTQYELNRIAAGADLAGGHVRNAVLAAAVQAGERPIGFADVVCGIAAEFRKLGRQLPPDLLAASDAVTR
jgi:hypothetical protein